MRLSSAKTSSMAQLMLPHKGGNLERVMKLGLLMVVAGLFLGCVAVPTGSTVWLKARSETVLLEDMVGSRGTGVVVNPKCVLMAAHVADRPVMQVTTASGTIYSATVVVYDGDKDVAVVCADKVLDAPAVTFGPTAAPYSPVFTIGFPVGLRYVLTTGLMQMGNIMTVPCAPGNSGGGVFNNEGNYVGFADAIVVYPHIDALPHLCAI